MKISAVLLFLFFTVSAFTQNHSIEVIFHNSIYYNVFAISEQNDTLQLTQFKPWTEIRDLKVSKDKRFCFFRYKTPGKAYRLVSYELNSLEKIAEIVPGFGGSFHWNSENKIVHNWGCGTNCAHVRVYDTQLNKEFSSASSGGMLFLDHYNYLLQFSQLKDQFWLIKLSNFKNEKAATFQYIFPKRDYDFNSFEFNQEKSVLKYTSESKEKHEITIDPNSFKW